MISDVLRQSVAELERYLAEQPEVYARYTERIEDIVQRMNRLREDLDKPPCRLEIESVWEQTEQSVADEITPATEY